MAEIIITVQPNDRWTIILPVTQDRWFLHRYRLVWLGPYCPAGSIRQPLDSMLANR